MLAIHEVRLARAAYKILRNLSTTVSNQFSRNGQNAAEHSLNLSQNEFYQALVNSYTTNTTDFIKYTARQLGHESKLSFQEVIQDYIRREALKKAELITDTSFKVVRKTILSGQDEGIGAIQIAANIRNTLDWMSSNRARTIARTETHNAATYGMQASAEEISEKIETKFIREWVSVGDNRTREAHDEADGQQVEMDEPFFVDGEEIDRPGEGEAENSINCRCTIIYIPFEG